MTETARKAAPKKIKDFDKETIIASMSRLDKVIADSLLDANKRYTVKEANDVITKWKKEEIK